MLKIKLNIAKVLYKNSGLYNSGYLNIFNLSVKFNSFEISLIKSAVLIISLVIFNVSVSEAKVLDKKNFISDSLFPAKQQPNLNEINDIRFVGNSSFFSAVLLDAISSKRTSRSIHHNIYEYYYDNLKLIPESPRLLDTSLYLAVQSLQHEVKYFNQPTAELDVLSLWDFYNYHGYHLAEIYYTFTPNEEIKGNVLTFHINENQSFLLDTIIYIGLDSLDNFTNDRLNEINWIKSGRQFNEGEINSEINKIQSILLNNGYFYSRYEISPVAIDSVMMKDSITVAFSPGKRQKIAKIDYIDSLRNQNEIVRELKEKLIEFQVGDWYSQRDMQISLNNLNALGTFEIVNIDTSSAFQPLTDSTLSIVIKTKYRKQKEWSVGLFLNNTQIDNYVNLGVEASLFHRNWGGAAQSGNVFTNIQVKNISNLLSGQKGEWEGQIGFKVSQPLIWSLENMKIGASGSFYYSYSTIYELFNISSWFMPIRFPIRLTNETYLNQIIIDFNFEFQNPTNFLDVYKPVKDKPINESDSVSNDYLIRFEQALNLYRTLYYYLNDPGITLLTANLFGITLIGDRRNHPFSPSTGDYFVGSVDGWNIFFAHPWIAGIAKYLRFQAAYSFFTPINENTTAAFKFKGGLVKLFDVEKAYIPFERQFFAGGSNSVRGWSSRELHYSVIEANADTSDKSGYYIDPDSYTQLSNILGSGAILEGSFEVRYTFPRPKGVDEMIAEQISKIGFVAFVDFGNSYHWLAESERVKIDIKWYEYFTKMAWAAGFGIRYDTPIGPIRADFGLPIYRPYYNLPDYKIWEQSNFLKDIVIHFGIGHSF